MKIVAENIADQTAFHFVTDFQVDFMMVSRRSSITSSSVIWHNIFDQNTAAIAKLQKMLLIMWSGIYPTESGDSLMKKDRSISNRTNVFRG